MYKIYGLFLIVFFLLSFSCNSQIRKNDLCEENFKKARELVSGDLNSIRQSAMDSSLKLLNGSMHCEGIRKSVVEFKIRLLISMERYLMGVGFVDSLKQSDFPYQYKKSLMTKNFRALYYTSKNDTSQKNLMYKEMAKDLKQYQKNHDVSGKEFEELFFDLFAVEAHFLSTKQINDRVDSLIKVYPKKASFFQYFKK